MLKCTDPFRELDRLAQQVISTPARSAAMPMAPTRTATPHRVASLAGDVVVDLRDASFVAHSHLGTARGTDTP